MDKYDTDYKDYYVTDGPYEYTRLGKQYSETIYKKVGNLEIAKDPRIIEQVHRDADLSEEIIRRVLEEFNKSFFLSRSPKELAEIIADKQGGE